MLSRVGETDFHVEHICIWNDKNNIFFNLLMLFILQPNMLYYLIVKGYACNVALG